MKKKNINNLLWVVFALMFIAGCGPSGSIGTEGTTTVSGSAVDILCDGASCGEDVAASAIIGVKITPAVEASAFTATLSCDSVDYPLTLASQEEIEDSMLFNFTHTTIPQVRPCTVTVSFVDTTKSLYGDSDTPVTVDFTIACDPTGSDDFSYAATLEKCWKPALVETGEAGGAQQVGGFDAPKALAPWKKADAATVAVRTNWDDLEAVGATVKIEDGALKISVATGTALSGKFIMIYKSFDGPGMPEVTANFADNGFDLRPVLDWNNQPTGEYSNNELYALAVGDKPVLADTCSFQLSAKGLPSSLGGAAGAEEPAYIGIQDWKGLKALSIQGSIQNAIMMNGNITEGGCGFETTDSPEVLTEKYNNRTAAMKQTEAVNCVFEDPSFWATEIYGGVEAREFTYASGFGMQDHVWQGKSGESKTIASDYFDSSEGTVVGFIYESEDESGGFIIKGDEPADPFVPFTLIVDDVAIDGVVANYE